MSIDNQNNSLNERIRSLRKGKGWTQLQLAEKLCVTDKAVSKWESGEGNPDISFLPKIAELFEVSLDYLLIGKNAQCGVEIRTPAENCCIQDSVELCEANNFSLCKSRHTDVDISKLIKKYNSEKVFVHLFNKESKNVAFKWSSEIMYMALKTLSYEEIGENKIFFMADSSPASYKYVCHSLNSRSEPRLIPQQFLTDEILDLFINNEIKDGSIIDRVFYLGNEQQTKQNSINLNTANLIDTRKYYPLFFQRLIGRLIELEKYELLLKIIRNGNELNHCLSKEIKSIKENRFARSSIFTEYYYSLEKYNSKNNEKSAYFHMFSYMGHGVMFINEQNMKKMFESKNEQLIKTAIALNKYVAEYICHEDISIREADFNQSLKAVYVPTENEERVEILKAQGCGKDVIERQSMLFDGLVSIQKLKEKGDSKFAEEMLNNYPVVHVEYLYNLLKNNQTKMLFEFFVDKNMEQYLIDDIAEGHADMAIYYLVEKYVDMLFATTQRYSYENNRNPNNEYKLFSSGVNGIAKIFEYDNTDSDYNKKLHYLESQYNKWVCEFKNIGNIKDIIFYRNYNTEEYKRLTDAKTKYKAIVDDVMTKITQCKQNLMLDIKSKEIFRNKCQNLTKEYFENEIEKCNFENIVIKLTNRLEAYLCMRYGDDVEFTDALTKFCDSMGTTGDDGWGNYEYYPYKYTDLLFRLKKLRNSLVHPNGTEEMLSLDQLRKCIEIICELRG